MERDIDVRRIPPLAKNQQIKPMLVRRNSAFAATQANLIKHESKPNLLGKALSGSVHLLNNVLKPVLDSQVKTRSSVNSTTTGSLMMKQARREHRECKPLDKSFQERGNQITEAYTGNTLSLIVLMILGSSLMILSNSNGITFQSIGYFIVCFLMSILIGIVWNVVSKTCQTRYPLYYSSIIMFGFILLGTRESVEYLFYVMWNVSLMSIIFQLQQSRASIHMVTCTILEIVTFHVIKSFKTGIDFFCGTNSCSPPMIYKDIVISGWNLVVALAFILYDLHLHKSLQAYVEERDGLQELVIYNLDLQHQLRVANFKTEADIVAPLTRAIQVLVTTQNRESVTEKTSSDIDYILEMLNSDRLFQPEIFQDTGDRDLTNFLQDVLQTRKNTYLRPRSHSKVQVPRFPQQYATASQIVTLLESSQDRFFNVFDLEIVSEGHALYYLASNLFQHHDLQISLGINERMFRHWLLKMESGYDRKNSYHNSTHAADVTHCLHYFITRDIMKSKLSPEDVFAVIIAAIGHDYMHPGFTNAFLVATKNPLALRYNDQSVLEQFHSASIFEIFSQPEYDILSPLALDQRLHIRELVTSMVLATDMAFHFEWLSKFKSKISSNSINMDNKNDKKMVLNMAIKCSDVNNLSKPLPISRIWTQLIMEEFFRQGDEERNRGLPISMFMDRASTDIPKCQLGFIDFIVLPLYESLQSFMPGDIDEHVKNIEITKQYWKSISDNHLPVEPVAIPQFSITPLRSSKSPKSSDNSNGSLEKKSQSPIEGTFPKESMKLEPSTAFSFLKRLTMKKTISQVAPFDGPDNGLLMPKKSIDHSILSRSFTQQPRKDQKKHSLRSESSVPERDLEAMFATEPTSPDSKLLAPRGSEVTPKKPFME